MPGRPLTYWWVASCCVVDLRFDALRILEKRTPPAIARGG
jgi:hypothetical protein